LVRWFFALICPWGYPKILVLELAIDRPGDMEYLVDFIPVDVGILTNISASHLEFFEDINSIAREKSILIKSVSGNGLAIVNNDNEIIRKIKEKLDVKVIDFGIKNKSKILASDINFNYDDKEEKLRGLSFKLNYEGNFLPIRLHHIIAKHHIYSVLAAVAVGNYFKINFIDAAKSLEKIMPPDGRMKLVDGFMDKSIIVDDTYNSSPVSAKAALETLEDTLAKRRVAVLGDMLELGSYSKQGHKEVIREVLGRDFEKLVIVGRKMKEAKDSICAKEDCESKIIYFETPDEAGDFLRRNMQIGDLILVKGSQSMRMEKVVEKIMKNPSDADKILCRQSKKWKNKKFQVV
jgi:UDP-N-acetylmuramoyl-tripeptide--D-alanyl-D-alanine ligase